MPAPRLSPSRTGAIHLPVTRTARIATAGQPGDDVRELWIVCHGYGQLSALFIRHFAEFADGKRWILAPEALSRFYHEMPDAARHKRMPVEERRVGAAWLTREDRDAEIADGIAYLSQVHAMARTRVAPDARLVVLGFSQGVSVACRWLALDEHAPAADHLICWCGPVPQELADGGHTISARRTTLVAGDDDPWVSPETLEEQHERLVRLGVTPGIVRFPGGHRMDSATLRAVAES